MFSLFDLLLGLGERLQGKNTEILRFTPLEVGDSGTYMCAATTTFHRKAQAYKVEVLLKCMPKLDITVSCCLVAYFFNHLSQESDQKRYNQLAYELPATCPPHQDWRISFSAFKTIS